jgi:hypothetical protein
MTFANAACCAEVLQQQVVESIEHYIASDPPARPCPHAITQNCTVVENGRVVVRPQKPPSPVG